jgi:Raf kinase inhibitor-like YbhB/YbcL family protein
MKHAIGLAVLATLIGAGSVCAFDLSSPDVPANGTVPSRHLYNRDGCKGQNVSPRLVWRDPPAGTRSFAVTMFDPDAPGDPGWWHWIIVNIPASVSELSANAGDPAAHLAPAGSLQVLNSFGEVGYGGPCPPAGARPHRYVFTVYALKVDRLSLGGPPNRARLSAELKRESLASASFVATFGR